MNDKIFAYGKVNNMDKYSSEKMLEIIGKDTEIKLVSFDIFDTLIFRCVDEPKQIFTLIGSRAKNIGAIPSYFADIEFEHLRVEAEKKARKIQKQNCGYDEVTLEEIYAVMPEIIQTESLINLEIDTEMEQCYANFQTKEVVERLYIEGKKIILTSDMYLSKKQIQKILVASGYKLEWFDEIFISSEYKVSKYSGQLFQIVLDRYKLNPEEIIHIGDNYFSDTLKPSSLGIKTYYYDLISDKNNMALGMEKLAYGSLIPQVTSVRKVLAKGLEEYNEEENIWYQIGAIIMGPVLAGYAEWIIETAQSNNIKKIFPLMREGKLIASVLSVIIKDRNLPIEVEEMYISRRAMLLPSMEKWSSKKLDKIAQLKQINIKDIFNLLKVDMPADWESKYGKYTINEAKTIKIGLSTLEQMVREYLFNNECTKRINENIEKETELAYKYLMQLTKGDDFLTADLGFEGTIQTYMNNLFKKKNVTVKNIHLLLLGAEESIHHFMEGVDIRGFVGNFGRNGNLVREIRFSPYIFEELMMCDEGTTVGYEYINDEVIPIKKDVIPQEQKKMVHICKRGIIDFVKQYLKLQKEKKYVKLGLKTSDDLMKIVYRIYRYPTVIEAKILSTLQHENMGVDTLYTVCEKEHIELLKKVGLEEFNKRIGIYDALWVPGLIAQYDPMFFYKSILENGASQYETKIIDIVQEIIADKIQDVIIIGAGEAGQKIKKYIDLYKCININITIEAFVDNNKIVQGTFVDNVEVKAFEESFQSNNYIIGSFAYTEELLDQLYKLKGNAVKVYCRK